MGYHPTISEEAKQLHGYQNDLREQKAHVIIPRSQVGSMSNDVGFEKVNGKYRMHLSEFDKSRFNTNKLKQLYAKSRVIGEIKKTSKGKVVSQVTDKTGAIKIRVRIG